MVNFMLCVSYHCLKRKRGRLYTCMSRHRWFSVPRKVPEPIIMSPAWPLCQFCGLWDGKANLLLLQTQPVWPPRVCSSEKSGFQFSPASMIPKTLLSPTCCVTVDKSLPSRGLYFRICEMRSLKWVLSEALQPLESLTWFVLEQSFRHRLHRRIKRAVVGKQGAEAFLLCWGCVGCSGRLPCLSFFFFVARKLF